MLEKIDNKMGRAALLRIFSEMDEGVRVGMLRVVRELGGGDVEQLMTVCGSLDRCRPDMNLNPTLSLPVITGDRKQFAVWER